MNDLWTVFLLSLLPGAGNFLGGMAAEIRKSAPRFLNLSLHTASGIVIAIVAIELMPQALGVLAGWWIAFAFMSGGLAYIVVDSIVDRFQANCSGNNRSRMWMIYTAVAVDLVSDGLMLGTASAMNTLRQSPADRLLVMSVFMHLDIGRRVIRLVAAAGFLGLLLNLTLGDHLTR